MRPQIPNFCPGLTVKLMSLRAEVPFSYVIEMLLRRTSPSCGHSSGISTVASAEFSFGVFSLNVLIRAIAPSDVSRDVQEVTRTDSAWLKLSMLFNATPSRPPLVVPPSSMAIVITMTASARTMRSSTRFNHCWIQCKR